MDDNDSPGSKVLPFTKRGEAALKPPRFDGFPKFAKEFRRGTAATVAPVTVPRLMQDTKRLPE